MIFTTCDICALPTTARAGRVPWRLVASQSLPLMERQLRPQDATGQPYHFLRTATVSDVAFEVLSRRGWPSALTLFEFRDPDFCIAERVRCPY